MSLQPRQKWQKNRRNQKVNDIVLLLNDQAPRNEWKLARITEGYPGSDDRVRKIRLLVSDTTLNEKGKSTTKTVFLERPVHKLVTLLEADQGGIPSTSLTQVSLKRISLTWVNVNSDLSLKPFH